MGDGYKSSGQYTFDKLELTNFDKSETADLRGLFVSLVIVHSIYENCFHGHIIIADSVGLQETFPVIGEETLRLVARTGPDARTISGNFRVYKVAEFKEQANEQFSYTLFFTSEEFINSEKVRISRSHKAKSLNFIINDTFGALDSEKPLTVDDTTNIQHIVISNKRPLYSLNMLTNFAVSPKYAGSNFFFYEDWKEFRFECYENMFARATVARYHTRTNPDTIADPFGLLEFKFTHTCDQLMGFSKGMYANKTIALDLLAKTHAESTFDYNDQFGDFVHTEAGNKLISSSFKELQSHQVKLVNARSLRLQSAYFKAHNDENSTFTKGLENVLPFRQSFDQQMSSIEAKLSVPGNTDLSAGQMIELDIPPNAPGEQRHTNQVHDFLSGKYLIGTVNHVFAGVTHTCGLTVYKDVYKHKPRTLK